MFHLLVCYQNDLFYWFIHCTVLLGFTFYPNLNLLCLTLELSVFNALVLALFNCF